MCQVISFKVSHTPVLGAAAGDRAAYRFLEFFTAQIRNPHTRRAYVRAVGEFCTWLEAYGVPSIAAVGSIHVAAYVEDLGHRQSAPTVKQHLAAIRMMFDWLATGGILPFNPATAVRGPKHVVKRGKTPVLPPEEARASVRKWLQRSRFRSLQRPRAFSSGQSTRRLVMTQAKGYGEPSGYNVPLSTETFIFADDGLIPNSHLPLIVRHGAITPDKSDPAKAFERTFAANGWAGCWRNGIYDYHHYHSTAHEVLGIVSGSGMVRFGGESAETVGLTTSDVVVIPAGVGHALINASDDFLLNLNSDGLIWALFGT